MLIWRHPHLPPSFLFTILTDPTQKAGQSRLTLVTGNEGCVRYPTEGNNSNHELTTTMQHLSNCLAAANVSAGLQLDFQPW
jgi:hypothetical protein